MEKFCRNLFADPPQPMKLKRPPLAVRGILQMDLPSSPSCWNLMTALRWQLRSLILISLFLRLWGKNRNGEVLGKISTDRKDAVCRNVRHLWSAEFAIRTVRQNDSGVNFWSFLNQLLFSRGPLVLHLMTKGIIWEDFQNSIIGASAHTHFLNVCFELFESALFLWVTTVLQLQ